MVSAGTIEKDTGTSTLTTIGIFMGVKYTDPTTGQLTFNQYYPASTAADDIMAYVLTDPDVVFLMQADGAIAQTALGSNFDVIKQQVLRASVTARTLLMLIPQLPPILCH